MIVKAVMMTEQLLFFRERPRREKMHIYAISG
jgi:hypothetical protein